MLAAVTLIVVFPPMLLPLKEFSIVKPRLPPVEMLFAVMFTVALPPMVPPTEFTIVAKRLPPVEMLFAVTFTVAFEPIVPTPLPLPLSI